MTISRDAKGIWKLDLGPSLEGFFERLQRLKCLETGSCRSRDRLKPVLFFVSAVLSRFDAIIKAISRKNTSEKGVFEGRRPSK